MKLIIQIPCLNEAESLPVTLAALPRSIAGCSSVEWLVIDDGSSDDTSAVAHRCGVEHVVRHPVNRGLAAAFMTGLDAAVARGADIIVNTDADNQYDARDIETLVQPIIKGEAEFVIGARPIATIRHFSWIKRALQKLGSTVVRIASRTTVADAPSGFRAMTRNVALRLNVFNTYTYTLETIIQAGRSNIRVASVAIRTNQDMRPSRLVKNIAQYVMRSLGTIVRIFATYRPMLFFWILGGLFTLAGLVSGVRFLAYMATGHGAGHVQSVILSTLCVTLGFLLFMLGFLADLIATNRRLLERIEWRIRKLELSLPSSSQNSSNLP
ncbi:glycosyltransferase family 2 protein [Solimonas terrae]|uniref:Glycosyltransferase family 2 protein n=1 Tax=Solimonas terrae TaxID=1396819 RepID=A0A6M2BYS6_9GAMM|nr:glycosyltransferase family 2 protein [Solimonas terrae]NGY06969.1 glycosyltransferase family 2 protein [Solimonas terrae]